MLRRRHDDVACANRLQISIDNQDHAAEDRADLFEELAPYSLVGRKKFSPRARLADTWQLRQPANFERLVGAAPNESCAVAEG